MKILVSAYACEPEKGSEPGAGWNLVREIARRHRVHVITRANNEPGIEKALMAEPVGDLSFTYHDLPVLRRAKHSPGGVWWYHYLWHMSLGPIARRLHDAENFDLAHQLTFGSFRFPGVLHELGIPTIVGPVGGAEEPPVRFWPGLGLRGASTEVLRFASNRFARFDPFLRRSFRSASLVLAVSPESRTAIRRIVRGRTPVGLLPQSGIEPERIPEVARGTQRPKDAICRVLHVGRLDAWKGAHLVLEAVREARRRGRDVRLSLRGSGPGRRRLERKIAALDLDDVVRFVERLPSLDDVFALYHEHDIFLFPSLRESGGMALLEAMAAGLPVVALSIGGPAVSITSDSGIRVVATGPEEAVSGMVVALERLCTDTDLAARLGRAAARRARRHYSWSAKGETLERFYRSVLEGAREDGLPVWDG